MEDIRAGSKEHVVENAQTWTIRPGQGSGAWLKCYVWDTVEAMRAYLETKREKDRWHNTEACYLGFDWIQEVEKGKEIELGTKKLGELHFHIENMGAGIVAHEIQHFLTAWVVNMEWLGNLLDGKWEPIAKMAGELTRQFWNEFYEVFETEAA